MHFIPDVNANNISHNIIAVKVDQVHVVINLLKRLDNIFLNHTTLLHVLGTTIQLLCETCMFKQPQYRFKQPYSDRGVSTKASQGINLGLFFYSVQMLHNSV